MIGGADLRPLPLFRGLTDDQLGELSAGGREVVLALGDEPFHEGTDAEDWWVLLDGAVDLIRRVGREDVVVARMDAPGRWAGGFRAWDDHGTYLATARCVQPGRMLCVPAALLRDRADAWFPFGAHLIAGLYHTARSIESTARQRDSLVTLGTLAAGIAHEINNPASAAAREVVALDQTTAVLLASLRQLAAAAITADQFAALDALRQELRAPEGRPDPLARADREQEIGDWLERHGVAESWTLAPTLAAGEADAGWCDRVAAVLGRPEPLRPALQWLVSTATLDTLLGDLTESTRRIVDLVSAVRSYTQLDRGSWQHVDVVDGLESTLTMLGFRISHGVEVVRDYAPDLPRIDAYAGELNQVWTNLIGNAIDAMDGVGRLRVSTRTDGDAVVVEIGDTGPGMSPEVAARAFEVFFTTKDVGQGTGLGLDIARRIVEERHGGSIAIAQTANPAERETVLRVRLPTTATR